jgi:hypothetical protein
MKFTEVKNYRNKPEYEQAMEWDGSYESGIEIIRWIIDSGGGAAATMTTRAGSEPSENYIRLRVFTCDGDMAVRPGDFVLPGSRPHEFYVCDPETFNESWLEVEEENW